MGKESNILLRLIDTQGLSDTGGDKTDMVHIKNMVDTIRKLESIDLFLICLDGTNPRFTSYVRGTINLFSQDYYSDRLFVKVSGEFKNSFTLDKDPIVTKLFSRTKVISILPVSKHPLLSSTYEIVFEKEINLDTLVIQLNQLEQIDFAEKVPIYRLFFTPNDPLYLS